MATLLLLLLVLGQETTGGITGTITDESGASLPAVTVTIRNKTTGRNVELKTEFDGSFATTILPPGSYSVEIKLAGFTTVTHPNVEVSSGRNVKIDSTLRAGADTEIVLEEFSGIDPRRVAVADVMNSSRFKLLPKGRSFQSLAVMSPSVLTGDIEGGIQINGASAAENEFIIDSISTNSVIDGRSRQDAALEYLQEVQVKTAGISAEYGGSLGGAVTAVTRSGGDEFHGEGFYYYSGGSLTASPVKRLVLDRRDDRSVTYQQDEKDKETIHEPGVSIGGPIRLGKLYFFSSIAPRRRNQTRTYGFNYGAEQGTIERKHLSMGMFNKFSFISRHAQGNVSWLYTPSSAEGTLPAFDGPGPNWLTTTRAANAAGIDRGFFSPQSSYSASVDITPDPRVFVSARGGFFWDNYKDTGVRDVSSVTYQTSSAGLSFVPQNLQGPAGTQNFPAFQRSKFDLTKRLTAQGDVRYFGEMYGSHQVQGGYAIRVLGSNVDISYPGRGYVLVHWDRSFTSLITGTTSRGQYGYYEINQRGTIGSLQGFNQAFYGQDQWQIHPRLTLHFGARAEHETIPPFKSTQPLTVSYKLKFTWADKVSPRFGASFDLFGDGRAKIFGSWGRFFDPTKYSLVRGAFGGDTWTIRYRSLDTLDVFSLGGGNLPGRDLWNPSVPDSFRDRTVPSFGINTVDPSLQPPSQDTLSIGAEYEWTRNTAIAVRYLRQNLRRAIEDLAVVVDGLEFYAYANPGEGLATQVLNPSGLTAPFPYPKAVRRYDAVEFLFSKRSSMGWFGDLSYTWSRLYGNYSGVASPDELRTPTTGITQSTTQQQAGSIARPGAYAKNNWDLDEVMFDANRNLDPQGLLATDRTHVLRFKGGYELPWGTEAGAFLFTGTGTPLTTKVITTNFLPVFVNGRGDMGRTPRLSYADINLAHTIRIDDSRSVRLEFNILNAFNSQTSRHRFEHLNRGSGAARPASAMDLGRVDLRRGYDYRALIAASPDGQNAFDPRYNMDDLFNPGFAARLGLKFIF